MMILFVSAIGTGNGIGVLIVSPGSCIMPVVVMLLEHQFHLIRDGTLFILSPFAIPPFRARLLAPPELAQPKINHERTDPFLRRFGDDEVAR